MEFKVASLFNLDTVLERLGLTQHADLIMGGRTHAESVADMGAAGGCTLAGEISNIPVEASVRTLRWKRWLMFW